MRQDYLDRKRESTINTPTTATSSDRLSHGSHMTAMDRAPGTLYRKSHPPPLARLTPTMAMPAYTPAPENRGNAIDEQASEAQTEADMDWLMENLFALRTKYAGQFVAILDQRVVASHAEFAALHEIIAREHPGSSPLIDFVEPGLNERSS